MTSLLRCSLHRAVVAALAALPLAAFADEADLARRLEKLSAELEAVKAELARLRTERASPAQAAPGAAARATAATAAADTPVINGDVPPSPSQPDTVLTSYGEINYNRPRRAGENAQIDLRRAVIGLQHRFDDKTKFVFELETEHAVTSADDAGEVAVEQAYIEHRLGARTAVRAGLFLIPAGLLNESHEPTSYYGVERNFVETAIIPSTWREVGVQLVGDLGAGFTAQGGVSTGFDLSKWDATSTEGKESPLGAVHQEGAQARARDVALFGAVNWRGVPGLLAGASYFLGNGQQGVQGLPRMRVSLWDVHARWTPGPWDLAAVYARGTIRNAAAFNATLVGNPTLVPAAFDGAYLQAAYRARVGGYGVAPFARVEWVNTARRYDDVGAGLTPAALPTERVITTGLNFDINPHVVVKADLQWFKQVAANNRINLGLGWSF